MFNKVLIAVFAAALGSALLIVGGCGKTTNNNLTVGPEGPTSPSGYYFTVMASPAVVAKTGAVILTVKVTDGQDNPINGPMIGAITTAAVLDNDGVVVTPAVHVGLHVYVGGGGTFTGNALAVDDQGVAGIIYTVSGDGGRATHLTFTLEDRTLTIPIQILP